MWDKVTGAAPNSPEFRVNRFNSSQVHHDVALDQINQLPMLYDALSHQLYGRCVSLQLYFNGELPKKELKALGFNPHGEDRRIWRLEHAKYNVSTCWIETSSTWILQVNQRVGSGILSDAMIMDSLLVKPDFHAQLSLELEVMVS